MNIYKVFCIILLTLLSTIVSAARCDLPESDGQPEVLRNLNVVGHYQPGERFDAKIMCAVIRNSLYTPKLRHIDVFLDDRMFSESNLESLFGKLSKSYPEPFSLTIKVTTNRAEAFPPIYPGRGAGGFIAVSEQPDKPDRYDHHQAIFYRRGRAGAKQYFKYNPVLKTSAFKTVFMESATELK